MVVETKGDPYVLQVAAVIGEDASLSDIVISCQINFCRSTGDQSKCTPPLRGASALFTGRSDTAEDIPYPRHYQTVTLPVRSDAQVRPRVTLKKDGTIVKN